MNYIDRTEAASMVEQGIVMYARLGVHKVRQPDRVPLRRDT